jgi:hypothetical protein
MSRVGGSSSMGLTDCQKGRSLTLAEKPSYIL